MTTIWGGSGVTIAVPSIGTFTWALRPPANLNLNKYITISDLGKTPSIWYSAGVYWRPLFPVVLVDQYIGSVVNIGGLQTQFSVLIPENCLANSGSLEIDADWDNSAASANTKDFNYTLGPANEEIFELSSDVNSLGVSLSCRGSTIQNPLFKFAVQPNDDAGNLGRRISPMNFFEIDPSVNNTLNFNCQLSGPAVAAGETITLQRVFIVLYP